MDNVVPNKLNLLEVMLHNFFAKETCAKIHRLLVKVYHKYAPFATTCKEWFCRFRNEDYDITDKEHGRPQKVFEDEELTQLLHEDQCQTQTELSIVLNDVINCSENWLRCTMESDILCESKAENRKDGMKCPPKQPICINKRFNIRKPPDYLLHQSLIPTECYLSKDHGQCNQDNSSPLMYYYDAKFNDCFGFLYSKCGGNLNKFSNKSDCMNRCAI